MARARKREVTGLERLQDWRPESWGSEPFERYERRKAAEKAFAAEKRLTLDEVRALVGKPPASWWEAMPSVHQRRMRRLA